MADYQPASIGSEPMTPCNWRLLLMSIGAKRLPDSGRWHWFQRIVISTTPPLPRDDGGRPQYAPLTVTGYGQYRSRKLT